MVCRFFGTKNGMLAIFFPFSVCDGLFIFKSTWIILVVFCFLILPYHMIHLFARAS